MKHLFTLRYSTLIGLLIFFSKPNASAQLSGSSFKEAKDNGKGTIVINYVDTPHFIYKDKDGTLQGISVDLMKEFTDYVFNTRGIEIDIKFLEQDSDYAAMLHTVQNAKSGVFGVGSIIITDSLENRLSFSPPLLKSVAVLITNDTVEEVDEIYNLNRTFKGFTAYAVKHSANASRLEQMKKERFPGMKIQYLHNGSEVVKSVLENTKAFAYIDITYYIKAIKDKSPLKRHAIGDTTPEDIGIIMPKKSDWKPIMDHFFHLQHGYVHSVNYKKILSKHFGHAGMQFIGTPK